MRKGIVIGAHDLLGHFTAGTIEITEDDWFSGLDTCTIFIDVLLFS